MTDPKPSETQDAPDAAEDTNEESGAGYGNNSAAQGDEGAKE